MNVYACGTAVRLKRSELDGVITAISIRDQRVTYGISYYEGGKYVENYFCDYEFCILIKTQMVNIGLNTI